MLNDAALMEACGVGLNRTDMYGVMMVCKQLGEDPKLGVATVRFFGKVLLDRRLTLSRACSCLGTELLHALAWLLFDMHVDSREGHAALILTA